MTIPSVLKIQYNIIFMYSIAGSAGANADRRRGSLAISIMHPWSPAPIRPSPSLSTLILFVIIYIMHYNIFIVNIIVKRKISAPFVSETSSKAAADWKIWKD